jgi:trimethylguanosine synthase
VPPVAAPTAVEKVHVTFDSDGEIAERVVEAVVVEPSEVVDPRVEEEDETAVVAEGTTQKIDAEEPQRVVDPAVFKFWKQRRTLFHKYVDGIQLDHESWYSVTPESIAQHIAQRCACDVIVDPFSGCGGNIIQFAQTCRQVIAIEIDADKIRMAKANAAIYGVADRIEWIHGDALQVLPTLRGADVVFLSPPWGGLSYSRTRFGVEEMKIGSTSGVQLFEMARRVAKNVVYYLPKTTPEAELQALTPDEAVECEHIHLNGQLKVVNAYYGDLAFSEYGGQNPRSYDENAIQAEDSEGQEPTTTENGDGSGDVLHVTE